MLLILGIVAMVIGICYIVLHFVQCLPAPEPICGGAAAVGSSK